MSLQGYRLRRWVQVHGQPGGIIVRQVELDRVESLGWEGIQKKTLLNIIESH